MQPAGIALYVLAIFRRHLFDESHRASIQVMILTCWLALLCTFMLLRIPLQLN